MRDEESYGLRFVSDGDTWGSTMRITLIGELYDPALEKYYTVFRRDSGGVDVIDSAKFGKHFAPEPYPELDSKWIEIESNLVVKVLEVWRRSDPGTLMVRLMGMGGECNLSLLAFHRMYQPYTPTPLAAVSEVIKKTEAAGSGPIKLED